MQLKKTRISSSVINLFIFLVLPIIVFVALLWLSKKNNLTGDSKLVDLKPIPLDQLGLDKLTKKMADADYVLLGESSHGTADYYIWRKKISQKLIEDHDFSLILVEGDWASFYRVNKYIKHLSDEYKSGREVLLTFNRWPEWMWANEEFLELVEWLREYNRFLPIDQRIGIYGKDLYGVDDSIIQVLTYLEPIDDDLFQKAKDAYTCLLNYQNDFSAYIIDVLNGQSCEEGVTAILMQIEERPFSNQESTSYFRALFNARQNALVVSNAEAYYRLSASRGVGAWNSRVLHMKELSRRLIDFYELKRNKKAKMIIWAHNTHVGDARASEMSSQGMINIGQLLREKYGKNQVYILGFGTNQGQVLAGREWGAKVELMDVPIARKGSLENLLNQQDPDAFILIMDELELPDSFKGYLGHRAKGVVYNPDREVGNYVKTLLTERYDAFIFIKKTKALSIIESK